MKHLASAILALALLLPVAVDAQEKAGAKEAAYRLMDAMGMETALAQSIDASLELGQQAVQDHLPELQEAIRAEAARLQQISGATPAGKS